MPEKAVPALLGEQRSADTLLNYVSPLVNYVSSLHALPVMPTISIMVPRLKVTSS